MLTNMVKVKGMKVELKSLGEAKSELQNIIQASHTAEDCVSVMQLGKFFQPM